MDKQGQAELVHPVALAERERLPDEPGQPLPQRVVPPLNVTGLAVALVRGLVLLVRDDLAIGVPEVGVAEQPPVGGRDTLPQPLASFLAPVAHRKGDDLARPAAQGQPDPPLVLATEDERPEFVESEFIEFQHVALTRRLECLRQRRQGLGFF